MFPHIREIHFVSGNDTCGQMQSICQVPQKSQLMSWIHLPYVSGKGN